MGSIDATVRRVLSEEGYRQRLAEDLASPGDVVVYEKDGTIEHVGVVLNFSLDGNHQVMSKFGLWGEYCHPVASVPDDYGAPTSFWTLQRGFDGN